jgi:hypothetical protein
MLRALSLALLVATASVAATPSPAIAEDAPVVAQQNTAPPPPSTPRRDCERQDEGVS